MYFLLPYIFYSKHPMILDWSKKQVRSLQSLSFTFDPRAYHFFSEYFSYFHQIFTRRSKKMKMLWSQYLFNFSFENKLLLLQKMLPSGIFLLRQNRKFKDGSQRNKHITAIFTEDIFGEIGAGKCYSTLYSVFWILFWMKMHF